MLSRKRLSALAFVIAIVILSFMVGSAFAIGEHNCTGENCTICLFTSKISFIFATICVLILTVSLSIFITHKSALFARHDTLITLKRKITS